MAHWLGKYQGSDTSAQVTDVSSPGRWHVDFMFKIILQQLLLNYDFKIGPKSGPRDYQFYAFEVPNRSLKIQIRPRVSSVGEEEFK